MLHRLDPFGGDFDVERAADFDDRANEAALSGGAHDRRDQLTVDLQPPRLDLGQADDRRVAAAEIVDLDVDAERLDLLDVFEEAVVAFVEIDRLDKLERQLARRDFEGAQRVDEALLVQPAQRDVDRQPRRPQALGAPAAAAGERALEHRAVDRGDDVELLGDTE